MGARYWWIGHYQSQDDTGDKVRQSDQFARTLLWTVDADMPWQGLFLDPDTRGPNVDIVDLLLNSGRTLVR